MPGTRPVRPELARLLNKFGQGKIHMGLFPVLSPSVGVSVSNLLVGTLSRYMLGVPLAAVGVGAPVDTVWPTANRAVVLPLVVEQRAGLVNVILRNGSVVSGNLEVGIYSPFVTKIASSGSVVQAGVNAYQAVSIPGLVLEPNQYFVVLVFDNAVARVLAHTLVPVDVLRGERMFEVAAAFPLPVGLTLAGPTMGVVPVLGVSLTPVG